MPSRSRSVKTSRRNKTKPRRSKGRDAPKAQTAVEVLSNDPPAHRYLNLAKRLTVVIAALQCIASETSVGDDPEVSELADELEGIYRKLWRRAAEAALAEDIIMPPDLMRS